MFVWRAKSLKKSKNKYFPIFYQLHFFLSIFWSWTRNWTGFTIKHGSGFRSRSGFNEFRSDFAKESTFVFFRLWIYFPLEEESIDNSSGDCGFQKVKNTTFNSSWKKLMWHSWLFKMNRFAKNGLHVDSINNTLNMRKAFIFSNISVLKLYRLESSVRKLWRF